MSGGGTTTTTTGQLDPTLVPLMRGSSQGILAEQQRLPLSSFDNPNPLQISGANPLQEWAASMTPGLTRPSPLNALALQAMLSLPSMAYAGPTTGGQPGGQGMPSFASLFGMLQPDQTAYAPNGGAQPPPIGPTPGGFSRDGEGGGGGRGSGPPGSGDRGDGGSGGGPGGGSGGMEFNPNPKFDPDTGYYGGRPGGDWPGPGGDLSGWGPGTGEGGGGGKYAPLMADSFNPGGYENTPYNDLKPKESLYDTALRSYLGGQDPSSYLHGQGFSFGEGPSAGTTFSKDGSSYTNVGASHEGAGHGGQSEFLLGLGMKPGESQAGLGKMAYGGDVAKADKAMAAVAQGNLRQKVGQLSVADKRRMAATRTDIFGNKV